MPNSGQLQAYRQALAKLQEQLAGFASGTSHVSRMERGAWIDITDVHAEKVRRSIAHLEAVLAQYGIGPEGRPAAKID
jgi:hypothetical protein